ncbi:glycosyltransferase family 4 protein [Geomonas sp. RF6]|uniref:glycosyltransferase family 4 protein n=1 Tax=Geomonas sp. RF6 TaxID=2897342 RepID=UPI001E61E041|nr:glycosyltransferase family 4 protein [Geomonas sp. RF6]UFS69343.1 glycosyltransferase family 4 protein [Geomonas sp. RF6]
MRILIYTVINMNGALGSRVNVETLARKLSAEGHEVVLFSPASAGEKRSFPFPAVYLRPAGEGWLVQKLLQDVRAGVELLRLVRRGWRPDVVFSRFGINTVVLPVLCTILRISYIADVHGSYEQTLVNEWGVPKFLLPVLLAVEKLNYLLSDRIITVSDELSLLVAQSPGVEKEKVLTIPNGIDLSLFGSEGAADPLFRERARGGKGMVFGFVGMFNRWLGVVNIIEAFALLKKEFPAVAREVKLLLVGDGAERATVEELIEREGLGDMVSLTGWVEHHEVPKYLSCFDVALAPYTSEPGTRGWGSSLKIMEYLAAGRWTIASEMTIVSRIIRETAAGYILPCAEPRAIMEGVLHAWEHRGELSERAQKARSYIRLHLSWEVRIRKIEDAMRAALEEKPCPET